MTKCIFNHQWIGCQCSHCHAVRDQDHDWKGHKCSRCSAIHPNNAVLIEMLQSGDYADAAECAAALCERGDVSQLDLMLERMQDDRFALPLSGVQDEKVVMPILLSIGIFTLANPSAQPSGLKYSPYRLKPIFENLKANFPHQTIPYLFAMSQFYFLDQKGALNHQLSENDIQEYQHSRTLSPALHVALLARTVLGDTPKEEIQAALAMQQQQYKNIPDELVQQLTQDQSHFQQTKFGTLVLHFA